MTITRNLVFNELRRRRRSQQVSMDADEGESIRHQFVDEQAAAPSEEMLDSELHEAIDAAIASLPENQRSAIVLRRYEGMPYEEIAEVSEDERAGREKHSLSSSCRAEGPSQKISGVTAGL